MYPGKVGSYRKSKSGFAFPESSSGAGALVLTMVTLCAGTVMVGEDRLFPFASQNWSLIGNVLPLFFAFVES